VEDGTLDASHEPGHGGGDIYISQPAACERVRAAEMGTRVVLLVGGEGRRRGSTRSWMEYGESLPLSVVEASKGW